MHLISFSILLMQVAAYALPTNSLSISPRKEEPESQNIFIQGKKYTATPLPKEYQGFAEGLKLEGGFEVGGRLVPAILHRIPQEDDNPDSDMRKTIELLKRPSIDLHLFSEWSKTKTGDSPYQVDIVVKDLRESDPPLKPFHEWYPEDKGIVGTECLSNLCKNVRQQMLWFFEHEGLQYEGFGMDTIFVQKEAVNGNVTIRHKDGSSAQIMPVYWKPSDDELYGVVDIVGEKDKEKLIGKYNQFMDNELEARFGVDLLAESLKKKGLDLREDDLAKINFQGEEYTLLQVRHMDPQITVYSIVGGFTAKYRGDIKHFKALMTIWKRGDGPRRTINENPLEGGPRLAQSPPEKDNDRDDFIEVYVDERGS